MTKGIADLSQWVGYKQKPRMKQGLPVLKPNGKPKMDKIPMNPHTGGQAQTNNPATWADYQTAANAVQRHSFDGLGFVFTQEAGVTGIDLDDCVLEDGSLNEFALEIVNQLSSYTEYSPSGDGVHILVQGSLPQAFKNGKIEMYGNGRFFTYTGKRVPGYEGSIKQRQAALEQLFEQVAGNHQSEDKPDNRPVTAVPMDDQVLIDKARQAANGGKFTAIWKGDISGYESQSEADYALCHLLAFWTGKDVTAVDRLFRQSGLYREKWDEPHYSGGVTYGEQTVARAIANTNEVYEPRQTAVHSSANGQDTAVAEESLTISTFADVDRLTGAIEWAWSGWLAKSYLHILASESGVGKSFIAMRLAGCFLCGLPWPDGQPFIEEKGSVLWCEAEAAQQLNKERAKSLGLPLDSIVMPNADPFRDIDLRNSQDKDAIWSCAFDERIRFIVMDSLSGADPRDENSSDKLSVLKWLAELARNTGKPILLTHHLNKPLFGNESVTLNRLRGSSAIPQMARVIWAMDTPDPNHKEQKRLSVLKSNLAKFPEPIGVQIDTEVKFGPAPTTPQRASELDRAKDFLQDLLKRQPVAAKDMEEAMKEADISESTVKRAKKQLGIKSIKRPDGWYWSLPGYE